MKKETIEEFLARGGKIKNCGYHGQGFEKYPAKIKGEPFLVMKDGELVVVDGCYKVQDYE